MGKEVQKCIANDDIIVQKIESADKPTKESLGDVIIDFSTAKDREEFVKFSFENKIPYCCFATNLKEKDIADFKELSSIVPVLVCSNASQGINVMFDLVKLSSQKLKMADVVLEEYHHKQKIDIPSGTARKIENILISEGANFETKAFRVGNECGTHIIKFFLEDEILEIKHVAKSRKIFALGAIEMARRICVSPNGFYEK